MAVTRLHRSGRRYPRSELRVEARLLGAGDSRHQLEATLPTSNISMGGVFFESTFFLKVGTKVTVELRLPPHNRVVRAMGEVLRNDGSRSLGGFAVRFTGYEGDSQVVLASFMLGPVLQEFIENYARDNDIEASPDYVAHIADVLAAWELHRNDVAIDVVGASPDH